MLMQNTSPGLHYRLDMARRVFSLLPFVVFVMTLMLLTAYTSDTGYSGILHIVLQSIATSLASSFVSIAAYGFYRYTLERSPGL